MESESVGREYLGIMDSVARLSITCGLLLASVVEGQEPAYWNHGAKIPIVARPAVIDSPEVRKLISEEGKRRNEADAFYREAHTEEEKRQHVRDLIEHPDQVLPGHREFVEMMAHAPAITLPKRARGRVIEISKARCLPDSLSTVTYIRVVIVGKNPPGGSQIWLCEDPARSGFGAP